MFRYFIFSVTNGITNVNTTYTIYWDSITTGQEAYIYRRVTNDEIPAINLTYAEISALPYIYIKVPIDATSVILVDDQGSCDPVIVSFPQPPAVTPTPTITPSQNIFRLYIQWNISSSISDGIYFSNTAIDTNIYPSSFDYSLGLLNLTPSASDYKFLSTQNVINNNVTSYRTIDLIGQTSSLSRAVEVNYLIRPNFSNPLSFKVNVYKNNRLLGTSNVVDSNPEVRIKKGRVRFESDLFNPSTLPTFNPNDLIKIEITT